MRARLVALAALVLAVALGMALGAGPLQHDNARRASDARAQTAMLTATRTRVAKLLALDRASGTYEDATATSVVRGTLTGHDVALVALPGADAEGLAALRTLLVAAGAQVTADVALGRPVATSTSRGLVEALTSEMVTQAQVTVPTDSDGYQRFGLLLARALGLPASAHAVTAAYDAPALAIMAGFQTAGLVSSAKVTARAALVLVVTGPAARSAEASAENAIPVSFLRALASQVTTVVAGPSAAARPLGIVGALRSGTPAFSTTDGVDLTRGRVAAVLALAAGARGVVGAFGSVGQVDGPIPVS